LASISSSPGRTKFGEDAAAYDFARPAYPADLFTWLNERCGFGPGTDCLDIGAGTGHATLPILETPVRCILAIEPDAALAARSDLTADFASAWQAASKVVYSTTLAAVSTADTRLERRFDPAAVRELKATAGNDLTVGGANLATQAFTTPSNFFTRDDVSNAPVAQSAASASAVAGATFLLPFRLGIQGTTMLPDT